MTSHELYTITEKSVLNQVTVIKKGIPSVGTEAQIMYNKRSTQTSQQLLASH